MLPHPLTNFEPQQYYQDESRFGGVYSRNNLPKCNSDEIKDEAYIVNLVFWYWNPLDCFEHTK